MYGYNYEFPINYEKTYFTIVVETFFRSPYYYISEKTFKGIQHLHPFVILGKPGILKQLKEWGFKTFDKWIDESYDLISDRVHRADKIVQELKKFETSSQMGLLEGSNPSSTNSNSNSDFTSPSDQNDY